MNKKVWFWVLGVLAAAVIAALIWSAYTHEKAPAPLPSGDAPGAVSGGPADHSGMDHGNMDHGPSGQAEDADLSGYLEEQSGIMAVMMADMEGVEPSGSAAVDFLAGMIPHHESAVAMAESYLKYGGAHEVLAPLAEAIITAQTEEVGQMEAMIEDLTDRGDTDAEKESAYLDAYAKLMDHPMSHAPAASLDAAFAEGMIMHHQMAVDMANAILPYTGAEDVTALAHTMIETQEQEIADMQKVLDGLQDT